MSKSEIRGGFGVRRDDDASARPSHWLVGLTMLAAVLLILSGASLLDGRLRPPTDLEPVATVHAAETPRFSFILGGQASKVESPNDGGPIPAPSPVPNPDDIEVDAALLEEVEAAYSKFWAVRVEATATLDVSRLPEVLDGPALEREREQIADLHARGVAAVIEAEHEVGLLSLTQDEAELYDEYLNRSYLIDPTTREPVGAPEPEEVVKVSFRLRRIDGVWKVVDSERHI